MLVMKKLKERVLSILEKGKRQKAKDMVMIGRSVGRISEEKRLCRRYLGLCVKVRKSGRFTHGNGIQRIYMVGKG